MREAVGFARFGVRAFRIRIGDAAGVISGGGGV